MASLNKVQLIGHLGRDPEVRTFQNGGKVVNLRVATSEVWKDRQTGERREATEWHSVAIFAEHHANFAQQFLRKGSMVFIEGRLETRKWQDQSGADRYTTEIVIRPYRGDLKSLDKRSDGDRGQQGGGSYDDGPRGGGSSGGGQGYRQGAGTQGGGQGYPYNTLPGNGGGRTDIDDEIPF